MAREISLDEFLSYQEMIDSVDQTVIAKARQKTLKTRRCRSYEQPSYYVVSPECFLQDKLPELPFTEAVDLVWPSIDSIEGIYDIHNLQFSYEEAELVLDDSLDQFAQLLQDDPDDALFLFRFLAHHQHLIRVPKIYLALKQIKDYELHAAVRDTTTYGACRKQNYDVAMKQLDGLVLQPQEIYNMNRDIANHPAYCSGNGGKFLFYEGVCGGSTQAFWVALLTPSLYVTKRYNHGQRYAGFYGSTIMGDDASMYEMAKQFEFKNISGHPVYFRTKQTDDGNTLLVSIVPKQDNLISIIQKEQT